MCDILLSISLYKNNNVPRKNLILEGKTTLQMSRKRKRAFQIINPKGSMHYFYEAQLVHQGDERWHVLLR